MKKQNPVTHVKAFVEAQSLKLSEKTLAKTKEVNNFLTDFADVFIFLVQIVRATFSFNFEFREFFRQCYQLGYRSLPLISVTGIIMGMVLTIQTRPVLVDFGAVTMLPGMVAVSLVREMGPVITALICAGKIGSGIGAELGSMKVTEQIDAMEVSSTNPMRFLVVTRVLAATLMIPLLILYADAIGIIGSFIAANIKGDVTYVLFFSQAFSKLTFGDFIPATIKSFFFGAAIGIVGCYQGYNAGRGTESVGVAANSAVVISSLLVIILDMIAVQIADFRMKDIPSTQPSTGDIPVIAITNLQKSFGDKVVLNNINLELFSGENLVVLGKSGSGKSVLVKCIIGLLNADGGNIRVLGQDVPTLNRKALDLMRQQVGFLFQSGALYDSMTVQENLEFPLRRIKKQLTKPEIDAKVKEVLDHVGLADALYKMPSELSGGMRKRISLARTIIVDPKIMLYDEPTTGLDPATSDEISLLINEIQKKFNTASIIITHDINCALLTADRIIVLKDGDIYKAGNKADFENTADPYIQGFFHRTGTSVSGV